MLGDVIIALNNNNNKKPNTDKLSVHRIVLLDLIEFKYLPVRYLWMTT